MPPISRRSLLQGAAAMAGAAALPAIPAAEELTPVAPRWFQCMQRVWEYSGMRDGEAIYRAVDFDAAKELSRAPYLVDGLWLGVPARLVGFADALSAIPADQSPSQGQLSLPPVVAAPADDKPAAPPRYRALPGTSPRYDPPGPGQTNPAPDYAQSASA